jgi:hypothetical protein
MEKEEIGVTGSHHIPKRHTPTDFLTHYPRLLVHEIEYLANWAIGITPCAEKCTKGVVFVVIEGPRFRI